MKYLNRYKILNENNNIPKIMPFIRIPDKSSDKIIIWNKERRLDNVSYDYYGTPYFDWLIAQKNAHLGLDEFEWQDGDTVIIPYPIDISIEQYLAEYKKIETLSAF